MSTAAMTNSTLSTPQSIDGNADPIAVYSRTLYDYTLGLWTESRRVAEEGEGDGGQREGDVSGSGNGGNTQQHPKTA